MVARVRSFNRTVTERVGALDDHYLGFTRGLGAARVLWEIGPDGIEVRELRRRLGLDSGYASRLLRTLERQDLVAVSADAADRRVRRAHLTAAGRAERTRLDERSDELAASMLAAARRAPARAPAGRDGGGRAAAAGVADRVRGRGSRLAPTLAGASRSTSREIGERFDAGFDPLQSTSPDAGEFIPPDGLFLVARLRDRPVGCGALRFKPGQPADLKRMWIARDVRGCGPRPATAAASWSGSPREHRRHRRAARDEPQPARGDRLYRASGLRRGRAVQRRALRAPLVREAARSGSRPSLIAPLP